jgi:hypothetical protein
MTVNAARDHWRAEHRQGLVRRALLERRPGAVRRSGPYPPATRPDDSGTAGAPAEALAVSTGGTVLITVATQLEDLQRLERARALRGVIDRLRPVQAQAMRDEIAGRPVQRSRKSTRHRARRRLRELLASDPHFA